MREKEAKAYAKESSEDKTNIVATAKAMTAVEGMGSTFLQMTRRAARPVPRKQSPLQRFLTHNAFKLFLIMKGAEETCAEELWLQMLQSQGPGCF